MEQTALVADSPPTLFMTYRRVADELSSGDIQYWDGKPSSDQESLLKFDNLSYSKMMTRLASLIREKGAVSVILCRAETDKAFVLDARTVEELRTDPVKAIRSMTYQSASILEKVIEPEPIRSGYDTLADTFGDRIYIEVKGDEVQCLQCGVFHWLWDACELSNQKIMCHTAKWASIATDLLISSQVERFFIPRAWNVEPWITRKALTEKYVEYLKEKETCLEAIRV